MSAMNNSIEHANLSPDEKAAAILNLTESPIRTICASPGFLQAQQSGRSPLQALSESAKKKNNFVRPAVLTPQSKESEQPVYQPAFDAEDTLVFEDKENASTCLNPRRGLAAKKSKPPVEQHQHQQISYPLANRAPSPAKGFPTSFTPLRPLSKHAINNLSLAQSGVNRFQAFYAPQEQVHPTFAENLQTPSKSNNGTMLSSVIDPTDISMRNDEDLSNDQNCSDSISPAPSEALTENHHLDSSLNVSTMTHRPPEEEIIFDQDDGTSCRSELNNSYQGEEFCARTASLAKKQLDMYSVLAGQTTNDAAPSPPARRLRPIDEGPGNKQMEGVLHLTECSAKNVPASPQRIDLLDSKPTEIYVPQTATVHPWKIYIAMTFLAAMTICQSGRLFNGVTVTHEAANLAAQSNDTFEKVSTGSETKTPISSIQQQEPTQLSSLHSESEAVENRFIFREVSTAAEEQSQNKVESAHALVKYHSFGDYLARKSLTVTELESVEVEVPVRDVDDSVAVETFAQPSGKQNKFQDVSIIAASQSFDSFQVFALAGFPFFLHENPPAHDRTVDKYVSWIAPHSSLENVPMFAIESDGALLTEDAPQKGGASNQNDSKYRCECTVVCINNACSADCANSYDRACASQKSLGSPNTPDNEAEEELVRSNIRLHKQQRRNDFTVRERGFDVTSSVIKHYLAHENQITAEHRDLPAFFDPDDLIEERILYRSTLLWKKHAPKAFLHGKRALNKLDARFDRRLSKTAEALNVHLVTGSHLLQECYEEINKATAKTKEFLKIYAAMLSVLVQEKYVQASDAFQPVVEMINEKLPIMGRFLHEHFVIAKVTLQAALTSAFQSFKAHVSRAGGALQKARFYAGDATSPVHDRVSKIISNVEAKLKLFLSDSRVLFGRAHVVLQRVLRKIGRFVKEKVTPIRHRIDSLMEHKVAMNVRERVHRVRAFTFEQVSRGRAAFQGKVMPSVRHHMELVRKNFQERVVPTLNMHRTNAIRFLRKELVPTIQKHLSILGAAVDYYLSKAGISLRQSAHQVGAALKVHLSTLMQTMNSHVFPYANRKYNAFIFAVVHEYWPALITATLNNRELLRKSSPIYFRDLSLLGHD